MAALLERETLARHRSTLETNKSDVMSQVYAKHQLDRFIVTITGISGAGKDEVAKILGDIAYFQPIKFVNPTKHYIEKSMNLTPGFLNDRELRNQRVKCPITGKLENFTYLDLLVKMYHERQNSYPALTLPQTEREIRQTFLNVCLTDMRSTCEALFLRNKFPNVIHLRVEGRGTFLSSDKELDNNARILPVDYTIRNDGSLVDLRYAVDQFYNHITGQN